MDKYYKFQKIYKNEEVVKFVVLMYFIRKKSNRNQIDE